MSIKALNARIAQLVERNLAKVEVAGSNPVSRSRIARVVESVDTPDLKSCGHLPVRVQVPPRVLRITPKPGVYFFVRGKITNPQMKQGNVA